MPQLKMKSGEARAIYETVAGLVTDQSTGAARKWPVKVSYWIARVVTKLQGEFDTSEKARLALAEEHGTKNEDGSLFEFTTESAVLFNAGMVAVNETEIDIELPQIAIGSFDGTEIEPRVLITLDKLIVEAL